MVRRSSGGSCVGAHRSQICVRCLAGVPGIATPGDGAVARLL